MADSTTKPDPKKKPAQATGDKAPGGTPVVPSVPDGWALVKDVNGHVIVDRGYAVVAKRVGGKLAGMRTKAEIIVDEIRITPPKKKESERLTDQSNRGLPAKPSPQKLKESDDPEPTAPPGNVLGKATEKAEEEARGLTNRFDGGHPVMPSEVRIVGRHLLDAARRAGTPIAPDVLKSLGDIFHGLIKNEAARIRGANRGDRIQPGYLDFLAAEGESAGRQSGLFGLGGESEGLPESVTDVAQITREHLMKMIDAAERQSPIGEAYRQYVAQTLLGIASQDAKLGLKLQKDVIARAEKIMSIPWVPMAYEAQDLLDRAKTGERFNEGYVEFLRGRLEEKGDGQAKKQANELLEMQRSWLRADRREAADRMSRGEPVSGYYLEYLGVRGEKLGLKDKDSESGELKRPTM